MREVGDKAAGKSVETAKLEHAFGDYDGGITVQEVNDHCERFLTFFYQKRDLSQVAEAVEYAADSQVAVSADSPNLDLYFFVRLAQLEPTVIPQYKAALENASDEVRRFVSSALRLATRNPSYQMTLPLDPSFPEELDVLDRPVTRPADLDYLWMEFLVTGNKTAVVRIIEVLEWPDRVRKKLKTWLKEPAKGLLLRWKRKRQLRYLRRVTGIVCDVHTNRVRTLDDLDRVFSSGFALDRPSEERVNKVVAALPFELNEFDWVYMWTKGSAKWSLASNADQHPPVFEVCVKEASSRKDRAQSALLEILIKSYLSRKDYTRAAQSIQDYMRLKPSREEIKAKIPLSEPNLAELLNLQIKKPSSKTYRRLSLLFDSRNAVNEFDS